MLSMLAHIQWLLLAAMAVAQLAVAYDLVQDYSGPGFFNGWDFYGAYDNLTLGEHIIPGAVKRIYKVD